MSLEVNQLFPKDGHFLLLYSQACYDDDSRGLTFSPY
jgi:hypothetical protein